MRLYPPGHNVGNVGIKCGPAEPESNVVKNASERQDTAKEQHNWLDTPMNQRVAKRLARSRPTFLTDKFDDKPDEPDDAPKQAAINQRDSRTEVRPSVAKADDHKDEPGTEQNSDGNRDKPWQFVLGFTRRSNA
jgi:hypothetical protein